ncbi:hypothetical protein VR010_01185 [Actinomycetaceae bacterium L2_0104]
MNEELPDGLAEHPFAYRVTKSGEVHISRGGRPVCVIRGAAAHKLLRRLDVSELQDQLALARVTGNYKRGNERPRA